MKKAVIVDYGMCNLDSVRRAVEECGVEAEVTDDPRRLDEASHIILPGVGAFPDAMAQLRSRGFVTAIRKRALDDHVPFLGICLGMQLMASRGSEGGDVEGLGLVPAVVKRLEPDGPAARVPHVGWNEVCPTRDATLLHGIAAATDFYFVHSYHVVPEDPADVLATTPYCGGFVSAVAKGNTLFGVQFHPEKSQGNGLRLLQNFIAL